MTSKSERSHLGRVFDDYSHPHITVYFASYDDIEDLCQVINWAYVGKPSASVSGGHLFGWINEKTLMKKARITTEGLRELIDDEEHCLILVAKMNAPVAKHIVGCVKIATYDKHLQVGDDEKQDRAVEYGLNAVDPECQSQGIGTVLYNAGMRLAKEYFDAQRVYSHIISSKRNQIEWRCRQGFVETGRLIPYQRQDRLHDNVDPSTVKFSVLTKRLE